MADTSWTERRRRRLKCKIHGLHYDPDMSTGCTLCLRDASKAQPTSRPPQLVLILLCILGMTAILFYIFGPGRTATTGGIDLGVASDPASAATKLDPEPYRVPVESLETALFRTTIDETEDLLVVGGDIQSAADDLSAAILRDEPREGLAAADLIARMGQAIPPDQVVLADIQRARTQWQQIRKQRFQWVDWFARPSTAETERVTTSTADYSDVASSLRALIEDGLAEVESLSDPAATLPEDDPAERWRVFAGDWRQQLNSLRSRIPARPDSQADGRILAAFQDLEQALSLARTLASSGGLPSVSDTRFDEAINAALRAQQGFDEVAP